MTDVAFGDEGAIITDELEDVTREEFVGKQNNLVFQFIQEAHQRLRERGEARNYLVESTIDSLELTETDERGGTLAVRVGWENPMAQRYEFGTSPHTVTGDPLVFVWQDRHDPPAWVREEFERTRSERGFGGYQVFMREVDVAGIAELRWVRGALEWFRRDLERRFG